MSKQLGYLSEQYESSAAGSLAIGYDTTGGTSYGKYQIASRTGTFTNYLNFCKTRYPAIYAALSVAGPADTGGRTGRMVDAWLALARSGKLLDSEWAFIKATHYDVALENLTYLNCRKMVDASPTLQNVLWSTAVQHGGLGAVRIFDKCWTKGVKLPVYIQRIYDERSTRFTRSTAAVQASVRRRFASECKIALAACAAENIA